ncbi:NAD(P)-dependent oxidoreductase [Pseudomonas syringae]|uniref:3-hydroxyisobutyrate dehydrogenase n=1 Tax=Pseudomonas syringae pv. aceris TaxID=199198 RepID=A0A0P9GPU3_PSESX|nr:NAD(P)-binding domain-containing protein [Pseudomonas syringae]KPW09183.1 3-hydroxyisobutyrate dehydrogenase [Pseudomonas syringae pv. aceris]
MTTIAWVGLGFMGVPMSKHMMSAGYTVRGVDIDPAACKIAKAAGVQMFDTIAEACKGAEAVFTMLPTGSDVKQVLTGANGVFASLDKGAVVIDCSTIGIEYARNIHAAANKAGAAFAEAPVSGGTEGAIDGTLTFMIGCEAPHVDRVRQLLQPMAGYVAHAGGPEAGQAAKVVNNLIMGVCVAVNCEATALAERLGLNLKEFFEIATRSTADNWTFRVWNPGVGVVASAPASKGYKAGFKTWLLAKDLTLAMDAGREVGVTIATAEAAHALLQNHIDHGGADMDATSLVLALGKEEAKQAKIA